LDAAAMFPLDHKQLSVNTCTTIKKETEVNKKTFENLSMAVHIISWSLFFFPVERLSVLLLLALVFFIAFIVTKRQCYWSLSVECFKKSLSLGGVGAVF
jgi:NADH:ubiquinone oxidoreductase subunit 6 (subunit J)